MSRPARPVGQYASIRVRGRRVNVYRRGNGSPVVLIEAGHLNVAFDWTDVVDRIAKTTAVVAYDRPGLGWSDSIAGPSTPTSIARHLHDLIRVLAIETPVILVGHSLGALYVRRFAEVFPTDVAGLVLVDPSHERQRSQRPASVVRAYASLRRRGAMPSVYDRDRWIELISTNRVQLNRGVTKRRVDFVLRPSSRKAGQQEVAVAWGRRGLVGSRRLPAIPFVVISAGLPDPAPYLPDQARADMLARTQQLHKEIVRLVPRGRLIVARRSGHQIMWREPELIEKIVRTMVDSVRSRGAS